MLILTRKVGETIRISDDIVIVIMGLDSDQVRLGIDAPKYLRIERGERRSVQDGQDAPPDIS